MRILYCGDVVGRAGRDALARELPGLIEDRQIDLVIVNGENAAPRLRPHREDLPRLLRPRHRRRHHGQPRLGPAGDAVLYRQRSQSPPPAELPARHARARRPAFSKPGAARVCWSPQVMGRLFMEPSRRSVPGHRRGLGRLRARRDRGCRRRRRPCRGDVREGGDGRPSRWPGESGHRHPFPRADGGCPAAARRHGLPDRSWHVRRLRFGHRHEEGGRHRPLRH